MYKYIYLESTEISIFVDGKKRQINSIYFQLSGKKYTFSIFLRDFSRNLYLEHKNDYVRIASLKFFEKKTNIEQMTDDINNIKSLKKYNVLFKVYNSSISNVTFIVFDNEKYLKILNGEGTIEMDGNVIYFKLSSVIVANAKIEKNTQDIFKYIKTIRDQKMFEGRIYFKGDPLLLSSFDMKDVLTK